MNSDTEISSLLKKENEDTEVILTGCGKTAACDPRRALHRYLVLVIMCFLSFGSYFCYDNPSALQDTMEKDLNIDTGQYMLFYSIYSWPNVILCFFGGYLIDKVLGIRLGAIVFAGFVTLGQVIFAVGALTNQFWLMGVGRFVFGLGGESLCVAQNTYAVSWFKDKELNMVFGLQLSFSRVGSTLNMNIMQPIYDATSKYFKGYVNLGVSLMIASVFCIFSLICAFALAYYDRRASRILKKEETKTGEVINFKDIKDFPYSVWILSVICVAYYVTVFPFIGLGLVFFEMKWDFEPWNAHVVNGLVYIISAVASPLFGFLIDKSGLNIFWVLAGVLWTLICHALLAFTFANPYIAMSMMGLAYSILASALWPLVAFVVPEHQLGTAYGIMQAVQNFGLAAVSQIAGTLVDNNGYLILEVFNLMWLCLALVMCVILYLVDASQGGILNITAKKRALIFDAKKEALQSSKDD